MEISLAGKRAFITAGGDGIGRTIALTMDALGAEVATCDVNPDGLASLPESIRTFECDVSDSAALDAVFDEILPAGLDVLVNNAGVAGPTKLVEDITDDEWRRCMSVGIDAQFYCARRVAPVFKQQQSGSIINMVSTAGIMGYPGRTPYAAAKWAVAGFTETLAMELGPDNVRVNGIAPGSVTGERMERVIAGQAALSGADPEEVRRSYVIGTSMHCFVDPEEIADLIAFLVSDYGRHISGQIIAVDGNSETLYPRT